MLSSEMKEKNEGRVEIVNPDVKPSVFKTMLVWIYSGECELPEDLEDLVSLLGLTDEYLLNDL